MNKKLIQEIIGSLDSYASQQRSLAEYNEKLGKMDVRVAILASALQAEDWSRELKRAIK